MTTIDDVRGQTRNGGRSVFVLSWAETDNGDVESFQEIVIGRGKANRKYNDLMNSSNIVWVDLIKVTQTKSYERRRVLYGG